MQSPKSNSSQGLVSYILDRTNSFNSTYSALRNVLLGTNKISTTFVDSGNREIQITTDNIYSAIEPIITNDINSVKVWPTFSVGSYFPKHNGNNEYDNLSLGGNYSLIRLNDLSEKYNHITIESSITNPVIFIILDCSKIDGNVFEFKINFTKMLTGVKPVVVFLDGTYSDIEMSNNGYSIRVDGIDYECVNSSDISYNLEKYNNKEILSTLCENDTLLVSVENNNQITNKTYGISKKINLTSLNNIKYNNYGLFDSEYIKTYQNNELFLTCKSLLDPSRLDDLVISYENNGIKYTSKNGQMYLVGVDDYRLSNSAYEAMSFGVKPSTSITNKVLLNNYPDQLNFELPYYGENSLTIGFNVEYSLNDDSVILHKIGIPKTNNYCVIRKSNNNLEVYIEGNNSIHNLSNTSNNLEVLIGFYVKLNSIYIRTLINEGDNVLLDVTEKTSDESIVNKFLPYLQTTLSHSISENTNEYSVLLNEYVVTHSLDELGVNGVFGKKLQTTLDYDDYDVLMSSKIIPSYGLEGHIVTLNGLPKSNVVSKLNEASNIDEISYRVSLIYNKQKGDFLYLPVKKYTLNTSTNINKLTYSDSNYSKICNISGSSKTITVINKVDNTLTMDCLQDIPSFNTYRAYEYEGKTCEIVNFYPKCETIVTSDNSSQINEPVGSTVNAYDIIKDFTNTNLKINLSFEMSLTKNNTSTNNKYSLYYAISGNKLIHIKDYLILDSDLYQLVNNVWMFDINDTVTNIDLGVNVDVLDISNFNKQYDGRTVYGGFVLLHTLENNEYPITFYVNDVIKKINSTLTIIDSYVTQNTEQVQIGYEYGKKDSIIIDRCNKKLVYTDTFSTVAKSYEIEIPASNAVYNTGYISLDGDVNHYQSCIFIRNNTKVVADSNIASELGVPVGTNVDLVKYNDSLDNLISVRMWTGFDVDIATTYNKDELIGNKLELYLDIGGNKGRKITTLTLDESHMFSGHSLQYPGGYLSSSDTNYYGVTTTKYYLNRVEITKSEFESGIGSTHWDISFKDTFIRINCQYSYYKGSIPFGNAISDNVGVDNYNGKVFKFSRLAFEREQLPIAKGSIFGNVFLICPTDTGLIRRSVVKPYDFKTKFAYHVIYEELVKTGQTSAWVDDGSVKVSPIITTTPTLPISITYSTLQSEYIDTYKDSRLNSSGWKLFGLYQLPINI